MGSLLGQELRLWPLVVVVTWWGGPDYEGSQHRQKEVEGIAASLEPAVPAAVPSELSVFLKQNNYFFFPFKTT